MAGAAHRVATQRLLVDVVSEATALWLRPRLADINRQRFMPIIARVLDRQAPAGLDITLPPIRLDLGELPAEGFEEEAERRLARSLGEAIERALRDLAREQVRTRSLSRLAELEHFLLRGALPFGISGEGFRPGDAVAMLADAEPAALDEMLRRHAHDRGFIGRIVAQLTDTELARLLQTLEPEHAALTLAYISDLRLGYRVDPPLPLPEASFSRLLWTVVLTYVLRDPGTQFNRRAFMRHVLKGIAESEMIAYADLVQAFGLSLRKTAKRMKITSSLPAIVETLLREVSDGPLAAESVVLTDESDAPMHRMEPIDDAVARALIAFTRWLTGDPEAEEDPQAVREAVAFLLRRAPDRLAGVLRAEAGSDARIERITAGFEQRVVARLVTLLTGERATAGLAEEVLRWPLRETVREVDMAAASAAVWQAALRGALRQTGFAQDAFLREIVEALARAVSWTPEEFVMAAADHAAPQDEPPAATLRRAIAVFGVARGRARSPLEWFESYLSGGLLLAPWPGAEAPAGDATALSRLVLEAAPKGAAASIRRLARGGGKTATAAIRRLLEDVGPKGLLRVLSGGRHGEFLDALTSIADIAASGALSAPARRAAVAAIAYLARMPASRVSRSALAARAAEAFHESPLQAGEDHATVPVVADFSRYDRMEAARHVLLFGRLPWRARLQDRALSVQSVLDGIATLPAAQLRALFAVRDDETRDRLIASAAEQLDETGLLEVAARILPPGSADAQRVRTLALQAGIRSDERRLGIARALAATLRGGAIDDPGLGALRMQAARTVHPTPSSQELLADLTTLILSSDTHATASSTPRGLLESLIAGFRADAIVFLRAVGRAPALRAGLLRRLRIAKLRPLLERLGDPATAALFETEHRTGAPRTVPAARPQHAPSSDLWAAATDILLGRAPPSEMTTLGGEALTHVLLAMIEEAPATLAGTVRSGAASPDIVARWLALLPDAVLARFVHLLEPALHRALLGTAEVLSAATREVRQGFGPEAERAALWTSLFDYLSGNTERSVRGYTAAYGRRLREEEADAVPRFQAAAGRLAQSAGNRGLEAALVAERIAGAPARMAARTQRRPAPGRSGGREAENGKDAVYIANAGLVLTGVFLPYLFGQLGLTEKDDKGKDRLKDRAVFSRAVHLLQYLVDMRSDAPEPLLPLNKILCGGRIEWPVERGIEMSERETNFCERLLKAMLQNWTALSGTSVAGLREAFLQRDGKLERQGGGWKLTVQRKTLDVLVDRVPWNVHTVLAPWMDSALYVTW